MTEVEFCGFTCLVKLGFYENGRRALYLRTRSGIPVATASVNVPDESIDQGHAFIKDWHENEGILKVLTDAGFVSPTGRTVRVGYCVAHEVKLNV